MFVSCSCLLTRTCARIQSGLHASSLLYTVWQIECLGSEALDHASTKNRVCHQPQLRSITLASCMLILHGTHSVAVGSSSPSWQKLFQPQVNAAPSSESTAQCLAPLQTCGRHAAAHEMRSSPHMRHVPHISQACLPAPLLASKMSGAAYCRAHMWAACHAWAAPYRCQDRCFDVFATHWCQGARQLALAPTFTT